MFDQSPQDSSRNGARRSPLGDDRAPGPAIRGELPAMFGLAVSAEFVEALAHRVAELLRNDVGRATPEPWIGVDAAAAHLACKPQRVYDLVSQRRVPFRRDGRRVLFRRSDLDGYLDREGLDR
jgi:excisionase family DNA binding protein